VAPELTHFLFKKTFIPWQKIIKAKQTTKFSFLELFSIILQGFEHSDKLCLNDLQILSQ
jgi:hypothetical protein